MFDRIQNKWKEEREKTQLTSLNEAFYGAMRDFLKAKSIRAKEEINPTIKKILEEKLNRIKYVVDDLLDIRTKKIIQAILNKEEITASLAREEQNFYDRMKQLYDVYKKDIFSPKDIAEEVTESIEYVAIKFIKNFGVFSSIDGKTYGPFEKEDICLLPKENAIGLVRTEIAENIELAE